MDKAESKRVELLARDKALRVRMAAIPKASNMTPEHLAELESIRKESAALLAEMASLK